MMVLSKIVQNGSLHKERVLGIVVGLATLLEDALEQIHYLYSLTVRPFQQLYCVKYSSSLNSYVLI